MYCMFALVKKGSLKNPHKKQNEATRQVSYYSPERTINNSYHISMLQTLRLLQSLSINKSWINWAQIGQNDLETNKMQFKHSSSK